MVMKIGVIRLSLLIFYVLVEPEQPVSYYENVNQLLKVFIQHPFIFNSSESLELLCNLLKQRVLELGLSHSINSSRTTHLSLLSSNTFTNNRIMCTINYLLETKWHVLVCIFSFRISFAYSYLPFSVFSIRNYHLI